MSGLMTSTQLGLIPSARIAQKWIIYVPYLGGSSTYTANTIHDETDGSVISVRKHGNRANSVCNISPKSSGDVEAMRCEISVDNTGGRFYLESLDTDSFFYSYGVGFPYMGSPKECLIAHHWYVRDGSSWSELPGSPWTGKIIDLVYNDVKNAAGDLVPGTAAVIAEAMPFAMMREPWNTDHAYTTEISTSYTPSGFRIGAATSGHTAGGNVWIQFTASTTVAYDLWIRYSFGSSGDFHATGTGVTTIQVEDTSPPATWRSATFEVALTDGSTPALVQMFGYPELPMTSKFGDAAAARPW